MWFSEDCWLPRAGLGRYDNRQGSSVATPAANMRQGGPMGNQRGLVQRIERSLENAIGDPFAREFGGSIVPQEV